VRRDVLAGSLLLVLCVVILGFAGCGWFQPQPAVDFSLSPVEGNKPLLVDFVPSAEGEPTAYVWDFGDGARSSEQAPSHVYYAAGVYSVTLAVSYDTGATVSVTKTDCVEVRKGLADEAELNLYWLDRGSGAIRRGALGGGEITTVVTSIDDGIFLTVGLDCLYWIDGSDVCRAQLDGTHHAMLFSYYGTPLSLCIDASNWTMYWTAPPEGYGYGGIMRSDPLGQNRKVWAQQWGGGSGDAVPWFLAIDSASGRLYYVRMFHRSVKPQSGGTDGVKADPVMVSIEWTYTGTFAGRPVIGGLGRSGGMVVDAGLSAGARYIYWTDVETGRIGRCKIDGTGLTWLITGLASPTGIAVDIRGGKLYWSDGAGIHRTNLDGSGQELIYPNAEAVALALG